jgi:predicted DCC family thiol-disulfide oxidoreductase YuxK
MRSTAALRVLRKLSWPWPIFYPCVIVPGFLRDVVYRFIARSRHRWFARPSACGVPKSGWRDRFIT